MSDTAFANVHNPLAVKTAAVFRTSTARRSARVIRAAMMIAFDVFEPFEHKFIFEF